MTMSLQSIRLDNETIAFYEELAKMYPHKYPTKADAIRAGTEFFKDFLLGAPHIERNVVEGFVPNDPSVKRLVLDVPKDDYNNLRELKHMGRGVSVPEIIRQFLRKHVRTEAKRIQREKEEQQRASEAIRAHENRLNLADSHLHE